MPVKINEMSNSEEETFAVVMDIGSGMIRAGFAGDDAPQVIQRTIVGRPRPVPDYLWQEETNKVDRYVGDAAQCRREALNVTCPLEHGIITDWDSMESVWSHAYRELGARPQDLPLLTTDPPFSPQGQRETTTQILFETFNVPALFTGCQSNLALYAAGRGSGIVLDVGDGVTHVRPIYESHVVPTATRRLDVAGRDLTFHLQRLLARRGYCFTTFSELELVRDMKETLCFVSAHATSTEDPGKGSCEEKPYSLPDGGTIVLGAERYLCAEALFQPSMLGVDSPGLHKLVYDALMDCDVSMRSDIFVNIILSGAGTKFPFFKERLETELQALLPVSKRVRVCAYPERNIFVWIGGSIVGSLSTSQHLFIKKEQYEEMGPHVVQRQWLNI